MHVRARPTATAAGGAGGDGGDVGGDGGGPGAIGVGGTHGRKRLIHPREFVRPRFTSLRNPPPCVQPLGESAELIRNGCITSQIVCLNSPDVCSDVIELSAAHSRPVRDVRAVGIRHEHPLGVPCRVGADAVPSLCVCVGG